MGLFGQKREKVPFHPEKKPEFEGALTLENIEQIFTDCVDFCKKELVSTVTRERYELCWVDGMVKSERLNDYVIRPLLTTCPAEEGISGLKALLDSGTWNLTVEEQTALDETVNALIQGSAALFTQWGTLTCAVATEEKRSISSPENEVAAKGSKDAFVESLRTNTSLVRRHLRSPHIRVEEFIVGRESRIPVDLVWIEGLTNRDLVAKIRTRITEIDIDGLLSTGDFEGYIAGGVSAFPRMLFTERPDRFCRSILDGRAGVLIEGIPLGGLLPGNVSQFLEAPQDRVYHWAIASALLALRYLCMLITLLLPGFYIAVASFHFEMIPTKLAMSIISSKQNVPFSTPSEVLLLLVAFEILQEAGLRLPKTIGQTVSIIGGLVVGQAAVDAKILSPAVVIVVAAAGIAGFTTPNQDFGNALRIWRFVLAVLGGLLGLFGVTVGVAFLICHLAGMESFGLSYLTPFAADAGQQVEGHAVFRQPIPAVKLRELGLKPENQRKQK